MQKWYPSLPVLSSWPELSHMVPPNYKEGWEMSSLSWVATRPAKSEKLVQKERLDFGRWLPFLPRYMRKLSLYRITLNTSASVGNRVTMQTLVKSRMGRRSAFPTSSQVKPVLLGDSSRLSSDVICNTLHLPFHTSLLIDLIIFNDCLIFHWIDGFYLLNYFLIGG